MGWASAAQLIEPPPAQPHHQQRHIARIIDTDMQAVIDAQNYGGAESTAMGVPALIAVVRLISSTINQLPLTVTPMDEVPEWLRLPRKWGSALDTYDLLQYTVSSMAVRGHAYLRCRRIGGGWRLDAVHPDAVTVTRGAGDIVELAYQVNGTDIPRVPYSPLDTVDGRAYLLPIPYMVTPDAPWGTSPVQLARAAFAGYATTEKYAANLFDAGSHSGGVLSTDADITAETAARWQDTWVTNRRAGKIPVLGSGLSYSNTVMTARDAAWIEARGFNAHQIAQMYGCPPDYLGQALIGASSSLSYNNAQDNDMRFRRNCIAPFCEQISDALSNLLPPGRNASEAGRVDFDYSRWESPPGGGEDATPANEPVADADR